MGIILKCRYNIVCRKDLFPLLDEDARTRFVMNLVGDSGDDKVSSLVHL